MNPLQLELPLLCRLDGPSVVPMPLMRGVRSYREAVRLCRDLSPRKRISRAVLAEETGAPAQHISDYFHADDKPRRRNLPGDRVAAFERTFGNTAISQWHALQAQLTVLEQMQADARASA